MDFLQLHILCNRDTRSEEDIALAEQLANLEIKSSPEKESKIVQEWRLGLIQISHIACIYPHARAEHTLIHLHIGTVLTIQEAYPTVVHCLNVAAASRTPYPTHQQDPIPVANAS